MRETKTLEARVRRSGVGVLALIAVGACAQAAGPVPSDDDVASYYQITARSQFSVTGNVAVIEVWQSGDHLRRGGALWAKVTPYIYLFTDGSRDLFEDYAGLAAIRVRTRTASGKTVAEVTLERDALNQVTWKPAINLAGRARVQGGRKMGLLSELVAFGEDLTTFSYSPEFLR